MYIFSLKPLICQVYLVLSFLHRCPLSPSTSLKSLLSGSSRNERFSEKLCPSDRTHWSVTINKSNGGGFLTLPQMVLGEKKQIMVFQKLAVQNHIRLYGVSGVRTHHWQLNAHYVGRRLRPHTNTDWAKMHHCAIILSPVCALTLWPAASSLAYCTNEVLALRRSREAHTGSHTQIKGMAHR